MPVTTVVLLCTAMLFVAGLVAFLFGRRGGPQRSISSQLHRLRKVPFLEHLGANQLMRIANVVRELRVPKDVYIIREQRPGESMYIVLSGTLHILKRGTHDDTLLQTVGPGHVIGEMALLNESRRIASARAITPCVLLQIDRDDFYDLIKGHTELAAAVWQACEVHSIELAAADHARTRGLSLSDRRDWLENRKSMDANAGEVLKPTGNQYLAVVTGSVEIDGQSHSAPALIRVAATQSVRIPEKARVCWLADL